MLNCPLSCSCSSPRGLRLPRLKLLSYDRYGINLNIYFCLNCGCATASPYFSENDLDVFYQSTYQSLYGRSNNAAHVKSRQLERAKLFAEIATSFLSSGKIRDGKRLRLLELGSSFGECIKALSDRIRFATSELAIIEPSIEQSKLLGFPGNSIQVFKSIKEIQGNVLDFVFCDHVLEHVLDVKSLLEEIKTRLNADSGIFAFAVPILERFYEIKSKSIAVNFHVAHVRYFSVWLLCVLAHEAGLTLFEVTNRSLRDPGEGVFVVFDASNTDRYMSLLSHSGLALSRPVVPNLSVRLILNALNYVFLLVAVRVSLMKAILSRKLVKSAA